MMKMLRQIVARAAPRLTRTLPSVLTSEVIVSTLRAEDKQIK
jgi:hypothetical protein